MALESGTYINSLNASNPAATDGIAQADDHMRLIKSTIKASFPGVSGAVSSTHTELNALDGFTGAVADLNYAKDLRATGVTNTEFDYLDGVTSNIQTQINAAGGSTVSISALSSQAPYQLVMMANQQGGASDIGNGTGRSLGVESEYAKLTYNPADSGGRLTAPNITSQGTLSKGSGSFKIDHPLPAKADTHHLVHSFVEGPQADNIYRGTIALVDGSATVNIDTASGMTDGTFVALNGNVQCFTSNETNFCAVKGSVAGNVLSIVSKDDTCTATVSWMVVGERHDLHMIVTDWTDSDGKVIVEPAKE